MPSYEPVKLLEEISLNLRNHTFFHGSNDAGDVAKILREGFKREFVDSDGRWFRDGNLGIGIYLSCNWRTSVWFGNILLKATLQRGTRILDMSEPPDPSLLSVLRRKYGAEILTTLDPAAVLPRNKSLTLSEFVALIRHHYRETWERPRERGHLHRWSPKRIAHSNALEACSKLLPRYGFHGYGHPADDNGILIFQPERIIVDSIIAEIPEKEHSRLIEDSSLNRITLKDLCSKFAGAVNGVSLNAVSRRRSGGTM